MAMMTARSPRTRPVDPFYLVPRTSSPPRQARSISIALEDPLAGVRGIAYGLLGSSLLASGGITAGLVALRLL
jgi:hypothetical protein